MNCKKFIRDGKVAVLYTSEHGAGWYSWNTDIQELLFDADIVQAILDNDRVKAREIAEEKYPEVYVGGVENLAIEWLDQGQLFEVMEYDGYETIKIVGTGIYLVA